eukprot:TRINITY_DN21576_c0_g1_i1.p1 TRINITY_DN21576_c0_g1~~TRINITY_DN21576_c0_g1_i1.p1  ORF type:complete len:372 (-),score=60.71 TRINITY_DN21576_c0_g1_i1:189-1304(-)
MASLAAGSNLIIEYSTVQRPLLCRGPVNAQNVPRLSVFLSCPSLQKASRLTLHQRRATTALGRNLGRGSLVTGVARMVATSAEQNEGATGIESAGGGGKLEVLEVFKKDILIVGPGVLGSMVATEWIKDFPETKVVGQTNTTNSHERLRSLGVFPIVKDLETAEQDTYPFVIFCAPPSGSSDYAAEVRAAAQRWNGVGSLLFTSSSALYDVNDGGWCDESAPVVPKGKSPRTDVLLNAEEEVLKAGGNVVRFAGLYTLDRGAHTFWLAKGTVPATPDSYLNLIHYEDAATLAKAILLARTRGQIFMGCDNHPVTRKEVMDATVKSGKFEGTFDGFTGTEGDMGKRMCNDATRAAVGWHPKYSSFARFLGVE